MKKAIWLPQTWVVVFVLAPLFYVAFLSLQSKGVYGGVQHIWTLQNFSQALNGKSFLILFKTFGLAFFTAIACTILAGLCASFISSGSSLRRKFWMVLFLVPFFINSLIRLFSLQSFVGVEGPVQFLLRLILPEFAAPAWSHNSFLMFVGMILSYLPFALLPLIAAFEKWDQSLTEASWDLGASTWTSFWKIKWPLLRSAFLASFVVVLIPAMGEYLVPEILEGAKSLYWGQYITEAFLKWRNWPLGSALGILLIVSLLLIFILTSRVQAWIQARR